MNNKEPQKPGLWKRRGEGQAVRAAAQWARATNPRSAQAPMGPRQARAWHVQAGRETVSYTFNS